MKKSVAPDWDTSCTDWRERMRTGRPLVPHLPLDTKEGARAVKVFDKLRLADVPGTPTMEEAGADWFRDIIRVLFGSLDPHTKRRAIRELFLLVPKKNAKTTQGALLMLTALLLNQRPRAPFILTAPVHDVADLAFKTVAGAIELDPVLDKKFHVREHLKTVVHRETKADLKIMTFDPAVLTGQKLAGALIDELHVVARMPRAASAIRQLRGGMIPFPEAFLAFITTQSEEPPVGVFRAELDRARAVRDGKTRGALLPVLYEFPPEVQTDPQAWRDPAKWPMITPNAGRSITVARLVEDHAAAAAVGEEEERAWASQHLNIEVGVALHAGRWAGADYWPAQGRRELTFKQLLERSDVIEVGIDGGGLEDMLGLSAIGRDRKTKHWLHWAHAWIHPIVLERRKAEASRFLDFQKDGDLTIVEKMGQDVEEVAGYVQRMDATGLLDRVGVDQHGISDIVDALVAKKIENERIVGISQGWKLVGPIKTTERKLAEGTFEHGATRLMAWTVGNAKVEARGNAMIITKQAAGSAKIDPLMATFDAAALMAMNPKPRSKKYSVFYV